MTVTERSGAAASPFKQHRLPYSIHARINYSFRLRRRSGEQPPITPQRTPRSSARHSRLLQLQSLPEADISVENPPIEAVIEQFTAAELNVRGGFALKRGLWLSWMQYRSFLFLLQRMDDPAVDLSDGLVDGCWRGAKVG